MEYDINAILEMYEDDYNPDPRPMNQGPRNMYSQGQLVSNTVDGSRPGYNGKPGGQVGQTKESRLNTRKQILNWFNKTIKKGPVSTSQIQDAFPKKSVKLIMESIGASNYKKLTRATPVETKITKEVTKIVNDVVANKKPLVNASAQKIYAKVYGRPFNIKTDNVKTVTKVLNKNPKFKKIKEKVRLTATRVGAKNEAFEKVLLKDFDKANIRTQLPRVSGQIVEESILRDLDRHIGQKGKDFKYIAGGRTNSYKTLKIKDVKNGDILTFDKIREAIKNGDPRFQEYNKVFNDMKTLKNTPYVNPVSGEKITLLKGLQLGTGIDSPLHLQHNKGIKESPLKNLSISSHKANQGARIVKSADDLKTLGIKGTLPGGKRVYGPDLSLEDNINRFTKFSDKMIKGAGTRTLKTPTETLKAPKFEITKIQSKGIATKLNDSNFKCKLANGLTCNDPRAYTDSIKENMAKASQGDKKAVANIKKMGKLMNGFKGAAKFTGWGLLGEIGFAAPLAGLDYAKGANTDEIISNASYGLFGKSQKEQLQEKFSDYGKAQDMENTYNKLTAQENSLNDQTGYGSIPVNQQVIKATENKLNKQSNEFNEVLPPSMGFKGAFNLDDFFRKKQIDSQRDAEFAKTKQQRSDELGILKPTTGLEALGFATGGIASLMKKKND